ncbi:hypothetical protein HF521_022649 [Silurus meridionalis]|uniref:Chloride channel CLIC-like protein 1 n=1 Tax=Silurus meridionalis TaxID=175797 RepID=A0A8T0B9V5_SILME|nr:hypothetical protein HF521_022649 [Silurus meridionalis]
METVKAVRFFRRGRGFVHIVGWMIRTEDPCKQYYETLIVNPILRVSPKKVLEMTMTALITDPLEHLAQGIDAFLRVLLDPLPIRLHISVLLVFVLSIMVFMYCAGQAAVHHAFLGPLRGGR